MVRIEVLITFVNIDVYNNVHAGLTTISSSSIVHIPDLDSKSNYGSQNGGMTNAGIDV